MTDASAKSAETPLERESWVVVSRDQVSADLSGETIILGMRDGVYYGLDGVGSLIWAAAAAPTTLGALHQEIVSRYEVDVEVAWVDLVRLVDALLEAGLLERAIAPSS